MREIWRAFKIFIVLTLLTGVVYPLVVTGITQLFFKDRAHGSLLTQNGKTVGSEWIGQNFTQNQYFWSRPSAGNYETMASSASNLTPVGEQVKANMKEYAVKYANPSGHVADEMLFTSASGLDPHISPLGAYQQADRVAKARHISTEQVSALVKENIEPRDFGFLGEERVNVLKLNLALDAQAPVN